MALCLNTFCEKLCSRTEGLFILYFNFIIGKATACYGTAYPGRAVGPSSLCMCMYVYVCMLEWFGRRVARRGRGFEPHVSQFTVCVVTSTHSGPNNFVWDKGAIRLLRHTLSRKLVCSDTSMF